MSATKTKRPRISKGILVTSSCDTTHNAIQAFKRLKQQVVITYNPSNYSISKYKLALK